MIRLFGAALFIAFISQLLLERPVFAVRGQIRTAVEADPVSVCSGDCENPCDFSHGEHCAIHNSSGSWECKHTQPGNKLLCCGNEGPGAPEVHWYNTNQEIPAWEDC